jgi:hypothetical protein
MKYMAAVTGLGCILSFAACDDGVVNPVGTKILPDEDRITVYADTFRIAASTVKYDSLYARSSSSFLGEFYDPLYGRLKSDYICQFYCKEDFRFSHTPDDGRIDSVSLYISYGDWKGDPAIPMQMTVYPVTQQLTKNFYTNVDPTVYCDMQHPVASQAYSAQGGIYDSTYEVWTHALPLPVEWGQKVYDETVGNPSSFSNQEAFNHFFPGFYITTGYGSGNMLYVFETKIIIYSHYTLQSSTDTDSVVYAQDLFNVSKDVIQLNSFQSTNTEQLLADNADYTYLKTPAGIFTRLVVPAAEIRHIIESRIVNYVSVNLKYMPQEDWQYAMLPPPYLLLIPEDSIATFFENRNIENSVTSYLSNYSSSSTVGYNESGRVYPFPNMANLLTYHIALHPDEDLRMLAIPVSRGTSASSDYSGNTTYYTTSLSHYLAPSGLKIRKDGDNMNMVVISSLLRNR